MSTLELNKATDILKNAGCSEVYLFGSQLTGHAHSGSDLDLGVCGLQPEKFFKTYAELDSALEIPVDLVDFDEQKDFFALLKRLREVKKIG